MGVTPANFSTKEFMLGEVFGERAWEYRGGTLYSPSFPHRWDAQAENVSHCQANHYTNENMTTVLREIKEIPENATIQRWTVRTDLTDNWELSHYLAFDWSMSVPKPKPLRHWFTSRDDAHDAFYEEVTGVAKLPILETEAILQEHLKSTCNYVDCHCGYYAFTNGVNSFSGGLNRVTGIIKGYGDTLIGDRGFRAKKAQIVALAAPQDPSSGLQLMDAIPLSVGMRHYNRLMQFRPRSRGQWMQMLGEAFPSVPIFASAELMKMEFPPTDLTEFLTEESNDE